MIAGLIASAVAIVVMGVNTWLYVARLRRERHARAAARRLAIEAANYRQWLEGERGCCEHGYPLFVVCHHCEVVARARSNP